MNRRHMIDDHHGRTAWRATLLVRAVDEILGTHRSKNPAYLRERHGEHYPRMRDGRVFPMTMHGEHGSSRFGRLSGAVPVSAAPDQDVCGVDMSLNSVHAIAD
jgi:hypothetical protein